MAKLKLAAVQVRPEDQEAEISADAQAVTPVLAKKPPKNAAFVIRTALMMMLYTLKVEVGGKEDYAIVLDQDLIDTYRSRFNPRTFVVAYGSDGLSYVFSVGAGPDTWSKSGRKMIAAASEGPITYWTDAVRKKYCYAPATKKLGKAAEPEWKFDQIDDYIELAYDEDLLIDGPDHELVAHFEAEAPESRSTLEAD